jgi:hypothetical protein
MVNVHCVERYRSDVRARPECRNRFGVLIACTYGPIYYAFVGRRPTFAEQMGSGGHHLGSATGSCL